MLSTGARKVQARVLLKSAGKDRARGFEFTVHYVRYAEATEAMNVVKHLDEEIRALELQKQNSQNRIDQLLRMKLEIRNEQYALATTKRDIMNWFTLDVPGSVMTWLYTPEDIDKFFAFGDESLERVFYRIQSFKHNQYYLSFARNIRRFSRELALQTIYAYRKTDKNVYSDLVNALVFLYAMAKLELWEFGVYFVLIMLAWTCDHYFHYWEYYKLMRRPAAPVIPSRIHAVYVQHT